MMKHALMALFAVSTAAALDACVVRTQPVTYTPAYYGYTNYAAPNNVYYQGGYHQRVYYPAGYYARSAPFVVAQPTTVYTTQPVYTQPVAQPVGVGVAGGVGVGGVGVSAGGGVRVGVPVY